MQPQRENLVAAACRDAVASVVVFLVALPLCLGVAAASNAPAFAGLLAGIVGGVLVGALSGSHTSVSGPAAGLTAVVAAQIAGLGSFEAFLAALAVAGVLQIALGAARLGVLAEYIPSSVIKGLLAAIGVILILKQAPVAAGFPSGGGWPKGPLNEWLAANFHLGSCLIGASSLAFLEVWARTPAKKSLIPAPLLVVLMGTGLAAAFDAQGGSLALSAAHRVQVPVAASFAEFRGFLRWPDFDALLRWKTFAAAVTIALVASLETLLNLEAVDNLDPRKRASPPNRELVAQGVGNLVAGLIGGLPVTSVIVRSSVNVNAGARSKLSAILHGVLLFACVLCLPTWLNRIPLSCLAAILVATGLKLASPTLLRDKWRKGRLQFVPFAATVVGIVATDLLIGVLIGLAVGVYFVLHNSLRCPLRTAAVTESDGEAAVRIELPNQVSFLNRAALARALHAAPRGGLVILDGRATTYMDPDVVELIRDFRELTDPPYDVRVRLEGFDPRLGLGNGGAGSPA